MYPSPNDFSGDAGDLVNTAGYRFNAPEPYIEKNYVGRLDLDPFPNHHLFGRVTYNNINSVNSPAQFPGDPETFPYLDTSHAWVVGWDWTIGNNKTNSVIWGSTIAKIGTPDTYNPQGANQYELRWRSHRRLLPRPALTPAPAARRAISRFPWCATTSIGRRGVTASPSAAISNTPARITPSMATTTVRSSDWAAALPDCPRMDQPRFNFDPSDLDNSQTSLTVYQSALVLALGRFEDTNDTWNYTSSGSAVPQGTGLQTTFRYYETEFYFGDTWKMTPSLTFTYGLRYQNFTVPYEIHGIESDQNLSFWDFMNARIAQSKAGVSGLASLPGGGSTAVPYVEYNLAGKANNAAGYYQPDNKDFAPRVAFAWTPRQDRKLVVNGGGGIVYDETVVNAFLQEEASYSYLFESSGTKDYGVPATSAHSAAYNSLLENTRFTSYGNPPPGPAHTGNHQALHSVCRPRISGVPHARALRPGQWRRIQYLR